MPEFNGRVCRICGAPITDDNPDGVGYGCRAVYNKAWMHATFHFNGLEIWREKVGLYLDAFIEKYKETKFRSPFRKSFYESIKKQQKSGDPRISKKQFEIMKNMVFDKLYFEEQEAMIASEKGIIRYAIEKFKSNATPEQIEYVMNCTKKYYSELPLNRRSKNGKSKNTDSV